MFSDFLASGQNALELIADGLAVGQEHLRKCDERRMSVPRDTERTRSLAGSIKSPELSSMRICRIKRW
jgi:hypothetical protein